MDKITCPVCSRLNDPQESRCWFCSAELNPMPPGSGDDKSWLSGLQEDLNPGQGDLTESIPLDIVNNTPEEQIPEWLARIRAREAAERGELKISEEEKTDQKKTQGGIPDWLNSVDENFDIPGRSDEFDPGVPDPIETKMELPAIEKEVIPPVEGESDWMESLKSWKPESTDETFLDNEEITIRAGEVVNEIPQIDGGVEEASVLPAKQPMENLLPIGGEIEAEILPQDIKEVQPAIPDELPVEYETNEVIEPLFEELDLLPIEEEIKEPAPQEVDESLLENTLGQSSESHQDGTTFDADFLTVSESDVNPGGPQIASTIPTEPILSVAADGQFDESIPFTPDDLPDWLNEKQPEEPPNPIQTPKVVQTVIDENLPKPEKGNLPAWLEAKRPIQAVELAAVNLESTAVEKTDEILPTLEGTIPEGVASRVVGKPSDLGGGLKLTERQKTNAALLASIIGSSEASIDEKAETVQVKRNVLGHTLFAIVLIILILFGGTTLKEYALQPALFPEEVVHTFDQINSLPVEKPVLIAADYEAALAGEIHFSSKPIIEHLMRRNLAITLISTNPVDTALLSSDIFTSMQAVPAYSFIDRVVDLGYLPGGVIAIQSLIGDFHAAVPMTAELTLTSTHSLLSSVRSLQDFGAVIVVTDDSESARVWIEQIQPQISFTPLLVVTSAQASPLVQPYYQSGQLAGLVSGMLGGLVYERILQTSGLATDNLASLQLVSIVMAGMILIGGFVSLVKPAGFGSKR